MRENADWLKERIASDGPLSVERFMAQALGDPQHGYYMTRDPFGVRGDFVTAPEISQMFGELLGLWALAQWMAMGSPALIQLVELGPGRGTMMRDVLRAAKVMPAFIAAVQVSLVETSPVLSDLQRQSLEGAPVPISWVRHIDDVPQGPALFLANEFFDALPIRQYVRGAQGWHERCVGLDTTGALAFCLAPENEATINVAAEEGAVLEVGVAAHQLMRVLAARLAEAGGAALVIDYGYGASRLGDSLQAVRQHQKVSVLEAPGQCDLTTHVDFSALARAARSSGARVFGPITQGDFLRRMGIGARAALLQKNVDAAPAIAAALERLAGDEPGMGQLFKVMAVQASALDAPAMDVSAGFLPDEEARA
jgi:SAM-dependent MidA family methyltransferase